MLAGGGYLRVLDRITLAVRIIDSYAPTAEMQFVEHWLLKAREEHDGDFPLLIRTKKGDESGKYGRWLAEVYRRWDGECLNERLKEEFEGVASED